MGKADGTAGGSVELSVIVGVNSSVLAVDRRSIRKCWEITRSRSAIYVP